jgi:hypothetical protein
MTVSGAGQEEIARKSQFLCLSAVAECPQEKKNWRGVFLRQFSVCSLPYIQKHRTRIRADHADEHRFD